MNGYITNIEQATRENTDYRRVLYTAKHHQLVLMSLQAGEEIGEEVHQLDQFFRFEEGQGKVIIDGVEHEVKAGDAVIVPEGTRHNVVNVGTGTIGTGTLKLYTIYAPPNHKDGTVQATKADEFEEHFDGVTTE
jgi:mannose-6-phosphate isomerase-like protein (cupin superfamily)